MPAIPAPAPTSTAQPDLAAVKAKQQAAWSAGDYSAVGVTLQIVGENLCETLDVRPGQRVLDVAAGNGNVSLAAARRFCEVVSTDYVPALLERGRQRAEAEGLQLQFRPADVEALPFDDASFDLVVSSFGCMFAPDHAKTAAEMLRVCRPGGRVAMANWTPGSFIGQLFKTIGRHLPPPAGLQSPALWGTRPHLEALFAGGFDSLVLHTRSFAFRAPSPRGWLDRWRAVYGPMQKAFAALPEPARAALEADLLALVDRHNAATDGTMVVPSEYVEAIVTKRRA